MFDFIIAMLIGAYIHKLIVKDLSSRILNTELKTAQDRAIAYKKAYTKKVREKEELIDEYNYLAREYEKLYNKNNSKIDMNNILIKKAIKKAMIDSHPDKGGQAEDFIAYKEIYDKVK